VKKRPEVVRPTFAWPHHFIPPSGEPYDDKYQIKKNRLLTVVGISSSVAAPTKQINQYVVQKKKQENTTGMCTDR
jgi:hypothetical protein